MFLDSWRLPSVITKICTSVGVGRGEEFGRWENDVPKPEDQIDPIVPSWHSTPTQRSPAHSSLIKYFIIKWNIEDIVQESPP